ncbi:MAG: aldo/keto reductase [Candidatus Helarchaeota archaeon]
MIMKLALGSAQFGMKYGINNPRGKIPEIEVKNILKFAYKSEIDTIDTAYSYGESERVIGNIINEGKFNLKIVSKFPSSNENLIDIFNKTLSRLSMDKIYGYIFHSFSSFIENKKNFEILKVLKKEGKIDKIGFSLYYPNELEYLLSTNIDFDIIQVPYSIFDQRFSRYFEQLKYKQIEIHTRSVFLQGLVFKNPDDLKENFKKIIPKLKVIQNIAYNFNINVSDVFLNFAILNPYIDKVVIGVDSIENLKSNIMSLKNIEIVKSVYQNLINLYEEDESIILPFNWS